MTQKGYFPGINPKVGSVYCLCGFSCRTARELHLHLSIRNPREHKKINKIEWDRIKFSTRLAIES